MRFFTWMLAGWFFLGPALVHAQERLRIEVPAQITQQWQPEHKMSKKRRAAIGALIGFVPGFFYAASRSHAPGTRSRWVSGLWLGSNTAVLGAVMGAITD